MEHESTNEDYGKTHFWIDCPGCGYDGKIGLPLNFPAEVVVCPKCRQVVRVRPEDRVLWRPGDAMEYLRRRFPSVDWQGIDEELDENRDLRAASGQRGMERRAPSFSNPVQRLGRNAPAQQWQAWFIAATLGLLGIITWLVGRGTPSAHLKQPGSTASQKRSVKAAAESTVVVMPPLRDDDATPADRGSTTNIIVETGGSRYQSAYTHYHRGIAHFKQGEYGEAVWEFTETIRCKPDSAQSFHWRAMSRIELGEFDAALDDMNRAISLRPRDPIALHARAVVFDRLGRLERARVDVVEAIRLSPSNHACLEYLDRLDARIDAASLFAHVGP